jgi:hypothetical protein
MGWSVAFGYRRRSRRSRSHAIYRNSNFKSGKYTGKTISIGRKYHRTRIILPETFAIQLSVATKLQLHVDSRSELSYFSINA